MRRMPYSPYVVYVLWSDAGRRFYVGITTDLPRRLEQHNAGESRWTKRHAGSWRPVWTQTCASLQHARDLESRLKAQHGGSGFWHKRFL